MANASTLFFKEELIIQKNGKSISMPKNVVKTLGFALLLVPVDLLIVHPPFLQANLNPRDDHNDQEENHA